jgi:hypothetical protein
MNGRQADAMMGLVDRERRLRNLSRTIGIGLDEGVKRNKSSLLISLSIDFKRNHASISPIEYIPIAIPYYMHNGSRNSYLWATLRIQVIAYFDWIWIEMCSTFSE